MAADRIEWLPLDPDLIAVHRGEYRIGTVLLADGGWWCSLQPPERFSAGPFRDRRSAEAALLAALRPAARPVPNGLADLPLFGGVT